MCALFSPEILQAVVVKGVNGDSNLRIADRRRLGRSGGTRQDTFPGLTVGDITASLFKRSP